jgi:two-component system chemotaxis response regulator CheB
MAPIRILIVDDSMVIRDALRRLLNREPERWVVCGEASDGTEALAEAALRRPEVVLLDLSIPGTSGLNVAREMTIKFPELVVVLMSEQEPSILRHLADHFRFRYALPKSQMGPELSLLLQHIEKDFADA